MSCPALSYLKGIVTRACGSFYKILLLTEHSGTFIVTVYICSVVIEVYLVGLKRFVSEYKTCRSVFRIFLPYFTAIIHNNESYKTYTNHC